MSISPNDDWNTIERTDVRFATRTPTFATDSLPRNCSHEFLGLAPRISIGPARREYLCLHAGIFVHPQRSRFVESSMVKRNPFFVRGFSRVFEETWHRTVWYKRRRKKVIQIWTTYLCLFRKYSNFNSKLTKILIIV